MPGLLIATTDNILYQARDPETALQYLEKGRAVILGQIIDNWSNLLSLMKAHPKLATQFKALCDTVLAIRVPNQIDGVVLPPQSSSYVSSQFRAYLSKS
jgi:hypothetical protein